MELKLKFVTYQYFRTDPDIQLGLNTRLHEHFRSSGQVISVTSETRKGNYFLCASVVQEMPQDFQVHSDFYT